MLAAPATAVIKVLAVNLPPNESAEPRYLGRGRAQLICIVFVRLHCEPSDERLHESNI
jgi:hypothetical protein